MSSIYKLNRLPDPHWNSFVEECKRRGMLFESGENMVIELADYLIEYHGKMIIDENDRALGWLDSLEFDSGEDLMYFKLKFT